MGKIDKPVQLSPGWPYNYCCVATRCCAMDTKIQNGTRNVIDGHQVVYYDGFWIRYYAPPEDSLYERKQLINQLTKRAFHQTEAGINTPGWKLELARKAWEEETDPARKRVNAAMLAGALFNRATDIFNIVAELGAKGVRLSEDNELMRECGECFREALYLGRHVRHYSGEEGIDEVWGEPFKAFTLPIAAFYESRYLKIAHTMREIDRVSAEMCASFAALRGFHSLKPEISELAAAAKLESETMKSDPAIFTVWPRFVAAAESLTAFRPDSWLASDIPNYVIDEALRLIEAGRNVLGYLAGARVPMPKTVANYLERCRDFRRRTTKYLLIQDEPGGIEPHKGTGTG